MIKEIHATPGKAVIYTTGGGFTFVDELMANGGASNTVLDVQIPYSTEAAIELLGETPKKLVSEETALIMANRAYNRAKTLAEGEVIGIGLTCKLTTGEGEREGRTHLIYGASKTNSKIISVLYDITGLGDRKHQEAQAAKLIISLLGIGCKSKTALALYSKHLKGGSDLDKRIEFKEVRINKDIMAVIDNEKNTTNNYVDEESIVFPGSFNPIHKNHIEIAKIVSSKYGRPVNLEISIENPDKQSINYQDVMNRMNHIRPHLKTDYVEDVIITRLPFFIDKANLWKGASFVVGSDTFNRIVDPEYYADYETAMETLSGNRFIVFHRDGHDLKTGTPLDDRVDIISTDDYEDDGTNSTEIREKVLGN